MQVNSSEAILLKSLNTELTTNRAQTDGQSANIEVVSEIKEYSFSEEWYSLATDSHFWMQWRLGAMLQQIGDLEISRIEHLKALDIGCGTGVLRTQVESATNWSVDGTDLNMSVLSKMKPGRGKPLYYNIFDENPDYLNSYDIVILYDVLEHIQNTEPIIKSLLKHIKPGGFLLVNLPALQFCYSRYDQAVGHVRRYNKKTLSGEFDGFDFEIKDVRYWGLSMLPLLLLRKLTTPKNKTDIETVKQGFKPPNELYHNLLRRIMRLELSIFSKPPLGTSILLAGRKNF